MYQLRIANVLGLDINNAQHSVGIDEAMIGINDLEAFIEYCRDKKDGIEYSTKVEKLDTLAVRYKKMQEIASLPHDIANSFSKELAKKVEGARTFIKNELEVGNDKPFSRLKINGEQHFALKELKALAELGSSRYLIELAEQNRLEDELVKLFLNKYKQKSKYAALSDNQKKVKALIGGVK